VTTPVAEEVKAAEYDAFLSCMAFSPDGHTSSPAASTTPCDSGRSPPPWPDLLYDKLTSNMSRKEWHDWVSPDIGYIAVCPSLPVAPS
jgi:hypothetical protein